MSDKNPADVIFSETARKWQEAKGSRAGYAKMEEKGGWRNAVDEGLADFLANRDSFYLATAGADGQPYIQHRGGKKGFLKVLDERTLAFADFSGNKQYISAGNLDDNKKAYIFLMDYANRRRIKIWGEAKTIEDDPELLEKVFDADYKARPERVITFKITAWDINCPQHIPVKYDKADVMKLIDEANDRIEELQAEIKALKGEA